MQPHIQPRPLRVLRSDTASIMSGYGFDPYLVNCSHCARTPSQTSTVNLLHHKDDGDVTEIQCSGDDYHLVIMGHDLGDSLMSNDDFVVIQRDCLPSAEWSHEFLDGVLALGSLKIHLLDHPTLGPITCVPTVGDSHWIVLIGHNMRIGPQ